MKKEFTFGIIGAAKIAYQFCNAVKMVPGARVAAVASNTSEKAKDFSEKNGLEGWYDPSSCQNPYGELLARKDIDAVYIATTHNFHYENMLLALNAGKHVICEKAFTPTRREAEEVFALAREKKLFCMEAMWSRFLPSIQFAKRWVDSGRLGNIEMANYTIGFKCDPDPQGRMRNPELGGGAMLDIGVYAIELTTFLVPQELKEVTSVVKRFDTGVDKLDNITLEFESCVANLQCVISCNTFQEINLFGENGRIHIVNPNYSDTCEVYDENNQLLERFYSRRDNGFEYEIREVIDCVQAGKLESDVISHRDTLQCAGIFDECLGN